MTPVTLNAHGVVVSVADELLDVGRDQRLATPVQRLALRAMYRTCLIPGCDTPFDTCEIHHLIGWERGGRTDLANLGPSASAATTAYTAKARNSASTPPPAS